MDNAGGSMEKFEDLLEPANVQVVVMMGGMGTRLKDYTCHCPKPLVDVNGKPFFAYQLQLLVSAGFKNFVFCVGHYAHMIEEYFGEGASYGIHIAYSYDGQKLLGTGGAIRKALPYLKSDFMVVYGDSFMDIDYAEVLYRYYIGKKSGAKALMTILKNENMLDKSNVIYQDGKIILYDKLHTVLQMNYIDYGVCIYERTLFENYTQGCFLDVADIQNLVSVEKKLEACLVHKRFYEIGTPESLKEFEDYAKKRFLEKRPAVFLDRDGVVNEIVFNEDTEELESPLKICQFSLRNRVLEALKAIKEKGYYIFVVTNQPAAAKGKTTLGKLYDINQYLLDLSVKNLCEIDGIFMCPHSEKKTAYTRETFLNKRCACRKPRTGLFQRPLETYHIDLEKSYMVGDSYTDILAGHRIGLQTVLIGDLKCDMCGRLKNNRPKIICNSLYEFSEKLPKGGAE